MQFFTFDASYIARLRAGDPPTQEHFVGYFTPLMHGKLRSRLRSPQAIEDVRQETFARVFKVLQNEGSVRHPERFGAFVNKVCDNVLFEHYRAGSRSDSLDEEGQAEPAAHGATALEIVTGGQIQTIVREILQEMPERDRRILQAVYIDERDRDEVCAEFEVDREYLRVRLLRSRLVFKAEYQKRMGGQANPRAHL